MTIPNLKGAKKIVTSGTAMLILGDCHILIPQLAGTYDAIITDPPYGIGYNPSNPTNTKWHDVKGIVGDDKPFDPSMLLSFKGPTVLFGANNYANRLPNSRRWYVWDKRPGMKSVDFSDCELAWCSVPGPARMIRHMWSGFCRASERGEHWHPTQKPIAVMRYIIEQTTKPGWTIFDPFMGSGSTALAARECGRKFIGIEIERRWFKAALERLGSQTTKSTGLRHETTHP